MPVRRILFVLTAWAALLIASGCGRDGGDATADETNDPVYQQAQDLKKQGRLNEALNAFLRVIDRRGENGAPESHLEAGALYLNWSHNPVEAYHHFSKYLQLQPTGPRAAIVRGQRDAAMREIARYLLAPANGQGVALDRSDEIEQLRRQVQELKAENETLRGTTSIPVVRTAPPTIGVPEEAAVPADESDEVTPVAPADSPFLRNLGTPQPAASSARTAATPAATQHSSPPASAQPRVQQPAPAYRQPASTGERTAVAPTRPTAPPQRPGAVQAVGRRHTVASGEKSLWGIARQYYPAVNQARVNAIFEANRDVMRSPNDLRTGMVLRIP